SLRDNLLEDRKIKLHDVVLLARQAIELDYQSSRKAGLSETEAFERGRTLLRTLKFGNDDYFYAFNRQGSLQSHPNPKIEGRNMYEVADSDGVLFTRRQIELAAKGGGFVAFRFPRVGADTPLPKIAYAAEFKPYDWVIGGGIYLDDIDAIFWSQL